MDRQYLSGQKHNSWQSTDDFACLLLLAFQKSMMLFFFFFFPSRPRRRQEDLHLLRHFFAFPPCRRLHWRFRHLRSHLFVLCFLAPDRKSEKMLSFLLFVVLCFLAPGRKPENMLSFLPLTRDRPAGPLSLPLSTTPRPDSTASTYDCSVVDRTRNTPKKESNSSFEDLCFHVLAAEERFISPTSRMQVHVHAVDRM